MFEKLEILAFFKPELNQLNALPVRNSEQKSVLCPGLWMIMSLEEVIVYQQIESPVSVHVILKVMSFNGLTNCEED